MLRRRLSILLILFSILITFSSKSLSTQAQASVTNIRITQASCTSVTVQYTLTTTTGITATLFVYDAGGGHSGSAIGPSAAGTYTTTIPLYSRVPDGTRLRVEVNYDGGSFQTGLVNCSNRNSGGGQEEPTPPPWEGFLDGRINADPAEYYTIFCALGDVQVYRSTPSTDLLTQVPISTISSLSIGESLDLGNFMTLMRNTEDTVTIYGSNGNLAPEPGSKAFSLAACMEEAEFVESIVDAPEATEEIIVAADDQPPAVIAEPTQPSNAEAQTDPCASLTGRRWAVCVYDVFYDQGLSGGGFPVYLLLLAFSCLMPAGAIVVSPITVTLLRRRFSRREER